MILIKKFSNKNYIVENTLVLNGLKEMIFILFLAFKGTTILLSPSWVSYEEQLRILHKDYISLKTEYNSNYKINPEELDFNFSLIKGNKLLILNNPCNPTGVVYSKNELKEIAKICKKHNVLVFADEIYLDLVYDTNKEIFKQKLYCRKYISFEWIKRNDIYFIFSF